MDTIKRPFYIKSNTDRGGIVEEVHYRNIEINHATEAVMLIQLDYKGATGGNYPATYRDFYFENINCNSALMGFRITGLPEQTVDSITMNGVTIGKTSREAEILYTSNLFMQDVELGLVEAVPEECHAGAGEEQPGRLRWKDLPDPVRRSFLDTFNAVVDGSTGVSPAAREEVKKAFAKRPFVTIIEPLQVAGQSAYRMTQSFGSDNIVVLITEDGRVVAST
jgi:hypothetical protein